MTFSYALYFRYISPTPRPLPAPKVLIPRTPLPTSQEPQRGWWGAGGREVGENPGHLGPETTGRERGGRIGERQGPRRLQKRPRALGPASGFLPSRRHGQDSQLSPATHRGRGGPNGTCPGPEATGRGEGASETPRERQSTRDQEWAPPEGLWGPGPGATPSLHVDPQLCLPQLKSPVSLHLSPHLLETLFSDDGRNSQGGWERRGCGASRGGQGQGGSPGQPARTCPQELGLCAPTRASPLGARHSACPGPALPVGAAPAGQCVFSQAAPNVWLGVCSDAQATWPEGPGGDPSSGAGCRGPGGEEWPQPKARPR